MNNAATTLAFSLLILAAGSASAGDDKSACPMHAQHMAAAKSTAGPVRADGSAEHGRHVDSRHDTFGMSHAKSTHSFRLFADGGAIELRATSAADGATVDAIRGHLQQVAEEFVKGDFSTPQFVHGYTPDGVAQLERLGRHITWRYERVDGGGRIRVTTKNAEALAGVHAFLRFQVTEHRTANTGEVEEDD